MDSSGKWVWLKKKDDLRMVEDYGNADVMRGSWRGPGWYFISWGTQRCPRNCCNDTVLKFTAAADRAEEACEHIRELAAHLREARLKVT